MINVSFDSKHGKRAGRCNKFDGTLRSGHGGEATINAYPETYIKTTSIYVEMDVSGTVTDDDDGSRKHMSDQTIRMQIGGEAIRKIFEAIVAANIGFEAMIKDEYLPNVIQQFDRHQEDFNQREKFLRELEYT